MKIITITTMLFLAVFSAIGQITITSDAFPQLGDKFDISVTNYHVDSFPESLFDLRYDTFTQDLTDIKVDSIRLEQLISPNVAPGGNDITGAEMVFNTALGLAFAKVIGDSMTFVGITPTILDLPSVLGFQFDEPLNFYKAPITMSDVYADSTETKRDLGLAKVFIKVKSEYEINGSGRLKVKTGEYDVLRLRRRFEFQIRTVPIFGDEITQEALYVSWEFLSEKDKWPVLRAATILNDIGTNNEDTVVRFEILTKKGVSVNNQLENVSLSILNFNQYLVIDGIENGRVEVYNLAGQLVRSAAVNSFSFNYNLSSLESAIYILKVFDFKTGNTKSLKVYKN